MTIYEIAYSKKDIDYSMCTGELYLNKIKAQGYADDRNKRYDEFESQFNKPFPNRPFYKIIPREVIE